MSAFIIPSLPFAPAPPRSTAPQMTVRRPSRPRAHPRLPIAAAAAAAAATTAAALVVGADAALAFDLPKLSLPSLPTLPTPSIPQDTPSDMSEEAAGKVDDLLDRLEAKKKARAAKQKAAPTELKEAAEEAVESVVTGE